MKLLALAWRNLRQRALSSTLTIVSILLGTALVAFLWIVATEARNRYVRSNKGFDVVVGPNGASTLDVVLNAVFLVKPAQGVLPFSTYRELHDDRRKWGRHVRYAIAFAYGDSYRGFPLCATTDEWFHKWGKKDKGSMQDPPPVLEFATGEAWKFTHADFVKEAEYQAELHRSGASREGLEIPKAWRKVVLGATAARTLGLGVGDSIAPSHGTGKTLHVHEEARSEIVGVLAPLGSPIDRGIYVPIGLNYRLADHAAIGKRTREVSADDVEISAIVVSCRPGIGFLRVRKDFMARRDAIAAVPRVEILALFRTIGQIDVALNAIAWIVLVVAALGIFLSLYNTMSERERDIAILRSIGARRLQIFTITLAEAAWIGAIGATLGLLGAHGAAWIFSDQLADATGVPVQGAAWAWRELGLILGVCALACVAGLIPAWRASATDVASSLSRD